MSERAQQQRFGNWLQPDRPGLFGLSLGAIVVAGAGFIVMFIFFIKGLVIPGLVIIGVTVLVVLLGLVKWGGASVFSRVTRRLSLSGRRRRGETFYVTGALSTLPHEYVDRLPGALVNVETVSGRDGLGRPYSLLHHKAVHQLAVVFGCSPDGSAMQEQEIVNTQVAHFGGWISSLSVEDGLSGATIVVDSASESSAGTREAIRERVAPNAPEFAKRVVDVAVDTLPARTSTLNVYSTLVWDTGALGGQGEDISSPVAEIAARMPGHTQLLDAAGGGDPRPLVEADLSRVAQLAYQPQADTELSLDELQGRAAQRSWEHSGPGFFDDSQGRVVFHDGVASVTLMMTVPPKAHITAKSFDRLFAPNSKFIRKRVWIGYRPVDGGRAAKTVDQLAKTADWKMSTRKGRPTSFDKAKKVMAEKAEDELARGARMSMFSIMVTVTFAADEKAYKDAMTQVKSLMNQLIMPYRFVNHAGSAAFHTTLPFGVLPWKYSSKPVWMEGAL